ncbi:DUF5693 family protein [Paenibacillus aurantius]|uniref:DUF5693 family protein n=1 Tax=Paenibacillus aurantius TaxID=2918900 RepID=A0AA96LGJ9_9BACL|nr:DUF5693 family protein [Paenibacillus aurantius]WNQ11581.1 DUF5693 family protein [Paenibacillus aurantius]
MLQGYRKWNSRVPKVLWALVVIGLLASLPLAFQRVQTEKSAKRVEFVFDYRDLVEIADYRTQPQDFVSRQLDNLKKAGVRSVAVYEATLSELQTARRLEVYNAKEAALLNQKPLGANENYVYVLFPDAATQAKLQPVLEKGFARFQVQTEAWKAGGRNGLVIKLPYDEAILKPLGPDPAALELIKSKGMQVVARISNRHQPFVQEDLDAVLAQYSAAGAKSIIVEGDSVPGYSTGVKQPDIEAFAKLMQKYGMGLASVELIKTPAGMNTLAKELKYNVFRAHSFTEADADKLSANVTDAERKNRILTTSDRFVLAVKDRNIRLVFLNAHAVRNPDKGQILDPIEPLLQTLQGPDGAIPRIKEAGFTVGEGQAHSFDYQQASWQTPLRLLVVLGSVAIIVLLLSHFVPGLALALLLLGVIASAGLYVLMPNMLFKLLALGAGISSASLAMMLAVLKIRKKSTNPDETRLGFLFNLFIRTSLLSLVGAAFVVGLLSHITYNLLLDQFTGVKLLGLFPVVVMGVYVLFFSEGLSRAEIGRRVRHIFASYINVLWVVTAGVLLAAMYYYMSRTGNEGQVSPLEMAFRSFLENTLGVRPRTKEFLIGHPLFFLGGYLALKYRWKSAFFLFLLGVIGQVDMVGTFTHLHTPIYISLIRVGYGMLFGALIGLLLIAVWEIGARSWKAWTAASRRL